MVGRLLKIRWHTYGLVVSNERTQQSLARPQSPMATNGYQHSRNHSWYAIQQSCRLQYLVLRCQFRFAFLVPALRAWKIRPIYHHVRLIVLANARHATIVCALCSTIAKCVRWIAIATNTMWKTARVSCAKRSCVRCSSSSRKTLQRCLTNPCLYTLHLTLYTLHQLKVYLLSLYVHSRHAHTHVVR